MAKAGDKYLGELEFQRPDGEYDVWTIVKRLDPAVAGSSPKGYPIYLIGTATNSGLLSDYYYKPERGESESKSLEEISADLEVLAQDGESYMSRVKRVPKKGLKKNPPFYAHNLYEKKTHGLNLKQMRRLYAMVSRGNQKAITYARNVLGIPFSESPTQVKAVVYHHVRDLAERRVRRNPRGYSNIEKSAFERGAYVGYSPKGVYKIRKMGRKGGWRAMGDFSMSFPPRVVTRMLYAKDLAEMSKRLQENPLTEDERYHLGRISRDPYLRRHFTGFTRKRKKARRRKR